VLDGIVVALAAPNRVTAGSPRAWWSASQPLPAGRDGTQMARKRLDVLLVERGLAESRSQAQAFVLAGLVRGHSKPGEQVAEDAVLEVDRPPPYVSRAGQKLAHALDVLGVHVAGFDCLDVGASDGGFTDVLLQRGARRVIALDVGYGQLHPRLRNDPRVTVLERTNARALEELPFARRSSPATSRSSRCGLRCRPRCGSPRPVGRRSSSSSRSSRRVAPRRRKGSSATRPSGGAWCARWRRRSSDAEVSRAES